MDTRIKLGMAATALQQAGACFGRILMLALLAISVTALAQPAPPREAAPAGVPPGVPAGAPAAAQGAAPAQNAAPDPAELQNRINAVGRRGFLYELVRGNQRLYLYGACSACKAEHFPLNAPLMQALAGSASMVVDVNYLAAPTQAQLNAEIDAMATLAPPQTLERQLDPEALARLQQVLPSVGLDLAAVNKFSPWMVGLVLGSRHLAQQGYVVGQNTTLYLLGYAKARQMPVVELEGQIAQFRLLASAPMPAGVDYLNQTVRDVMAGRLTKKQELLVEQGWLVGDAASVQRFMQVEQASAGPWASFQRAQWLEARNRELAARIESGTQPLPAMVSLPAQRLFGSVGVLALLQGAGFTARGHADPVSSTACGTGAVAGNIYATALGNIAVATGQSSVAIGVSAAASQLSSIAIGSNSQSTAGASIAMGMNAIANGTGSTAIGSTTIASAQHALALGDQAHATGVESTAIGNLSVASAPNANAFGNQATASAQDTNAIGTEEHAGRGREHLSRPGGGGSGHDAPVGLRPLGRQGQWLGGFARPRGCGGRLRRALVMQGDEHDPPPDSTAQADAHGIGHPFPSRKRAQHHE